MDSRAIGMPGQPAPAGRALAQPGIEHLAADSPEARGRPERTFRTPQDRLPEEVALAGIAAALAINRRKAKTNESQRDHFIKAAREAGCSEDEAVFDENLKKIARHKPAAAAPSGPAKRKTKKPGQ